MTTKSPRKFSTAFKAQIALEVIQGRPINEVCSQHGLHPTQVRRWHEQAKDGLQASFSDNHGQVVKEKDEMIDELHKQIGKLTVQLDWLKKTSAVAENYQA